MSIELSHIPQLFTGCFILFLGYFVLNKSKNSAVNKRFFEFCFVVALWQVAYFFAYLLEPNAALWAFKIGYTGVILIPVCTYHFSSTYFVFEENKKIIRIFYVLTIIFETLLWLTDTFIVPTPQHYSWGLYPRAGGLHPLFITYLICLVARLYYQLARKYIKSSRDRVDEKLKAGYVVWAVTLFSLAVADFVPNYGISIYPIGYVFVGIFSGMLAYGILKYQIMDINVVIKKTAIYSVSVLLVSVFYITLIFSIHRLFFYEKIAQPDLLGSLLLILLISVSLKPIETKIVRVLDRRFFKGSIFEISEQKQKLESELERSERLKTVGILAAGMAHEIKNPITAIKTFSEYLPSKYADPEFRKRFSEIVSREADRIQSIVTDLLLFSKPSEPHPTEVCINQVLDEILTLLTGDLSKARVRVNFDFERLNKRAFVDANQIKQAFLNIIMNAVDAMRETGGGTLTVRTRVVEDQLQVVIEDTGPGIPADKLKYIFDPFYTDKEGGTGLGLAVTYSIIEKNRGKIKIESQIGAGTKFKVILLCS